MYRERIHLTVRDMDGWNETVDAVAEINKICTRIGNPTGQLWTETIGVFNHLVVEIDHESLASYETTTKALRAEPEVHKQLLRVTAATVEGKGYTELLELATPV
ncbi:MAG: hypothetical protein JWO88_1652 [Frankiales bacterium]|jgi:hypothetical protein|nr:hypothetical protein [Frankiales bacterium]